MDKKKLDTFRKRLETRRQELRHMVTRNQQDGRTADDEATQDVADRAASSYNKEFLFSQSNNDRQLLNMVDSALARINEGSFGECVWRQRNQRQASRSRALDPPLHCLPGKSREGPTGSCAIIHELGSDCGAGAPPAFVVGSSRTSAAALTLRKSAC